MLPVCFFTFTCGTLANEVPLRS